MNEKYHEMILEKIHISGVEEWYCPTCGRRFLVQWPPAYKMLILAVGDKDIRHNVSKSNSHIRSCPVTQLEANDLTDEFRLIPWIQWMEKVNFDSKWNTNDSLT
jgi:hypothetical protein